VLSNLPVVALVLCTLYLVGVFLDADDYHFTDADCGDDESVSAVTVNANPERGQGCLHACVAIPTLAAAFLSAALNSKQAFSLEPSIHTDNTIRDCAISFFAAAVCASLFAAPRATSRLISSRPWLMSPRVRMGALVMVPPVLAAIALFTMALAPQVLYLLSGGDSVSPGPSTCTSSFIGKLNDWWIFSDSSINRSGSKLHFTCSGWPSSPWLGAIASVACCAFADALVRRGCEALPVARTFSPGEAAVVAQGVGLLTMAAARATIVARVDISGDSERKSIFSNQNSSVMGNSEWTASLQKLISKATAVWPITLDNHNELDYDALVLTVVWVGLCAVIWISVASLYVDIAVPSACFSALERRLRSIIRSVSEFSEVIPVMVVGACAMWCWLAAVLPVGPIPWLLGILLQPSSSHRNDVGTNADSGSHTENESQQESLASWFVVDFHTMWSIAVEVPPRLGILVLWALGLAAAVAVAGKFDPAIEVESHHNLDSKQGNNVDDARSDSQIDSFGTLDSRIMSSKLLSPASTSPPPRRSISSADPSLSSSTTSSSSSSSTLSSSRLSSSTSSCLPLQSILFSPSSSPSSVSKNMVPTSSTSSPSRSSSSASWLGIEAPPHDPSLISESKLSVSSTSSSLLHSSSARHFTSSETTSIDPSTPASSASSSVSSSTSASTYSISSFMAPKMALNSASPSDDKDFKQFQSRVRALQRRIDAAVHCNTIPEEDSSSAASVAGFSELDATAYSETTSSRALLEKRQPQLSFMPVSLDSSQKRHRVVLARKGFHLVVVVLFTPVSDATILSLSYAVALSLFLLIEVIRVTGGPLLECSDEDSALGAKTTTIAPNSANNDGSDGASPLKRALRKSRQSGLNLIRLALRRYYSKFTDNREATGPNDATPQLVLTPLYLLLGCALPHWLAHAAFPLSMTEAVANTCTNSSLQPWNYASGISSDRTGYSSTARAALVATARRTMVNNVEAGDACFLLQRKQAAVVLVALSGVLTLGVGDAVAACIGTLYGRTKWPWQQPGQKRTLEGSASALLAMLFTVALVIVMRFPQKPRDLVAPETTPGNNLHVSTPGASATLMSPLVYDLLPSLVLPFALVCALEAFANAIDNLVLPIYGTALLVAALL